jgi:glycerol-3-phosphate acyltransferase PlsX
VKNGEAKAFVSAGCTGALLTGATVIVGRLKGVERPALATLIPTKKGFSLLIDCGANVDSKPTYLAQFAKMGSIYMENILNINSPKVGLVNIGEEREKGDTLTKEAYPLLEQAGVNFIGNVEAREIPFGKADVVVCDAFVGNVILKYTEGFAKVLLSIMKAEIMQGALSKLGALLIKPALKRMMKKLDYTEYGGAPLLGLKGLVVKTHGSADANAVKNTIKQCVNLVQTQVVEKTSVKILENNNEQENK